MAPYPTSVASSSRLPCSYLAFIIKRRRRAGHCIPSPTKKKKKKFQRKKKKRKKKKKKIKSIMCGGAIISNFIPVDPGGHKLSAQDFWSDFDIYSDFILYNSSSDPTANYHAPAPHVLGQYPPRPPPPGILYMHALRSCPTCYFRFFFSLRNTWMLCVGKGASVRGW